MFVVPKVYGELSRKQVLVTELIPGVPLDQCADLSQQTRDRLGMSPYPTQVLSEFYWLWNTIYAVRGLITHCSATLIPGLCYPDCWSN